MNEWPVEIGVSSPTHEQLVLVSSGTEAKTLRAAQANPESYRDLIVRVAGFSAYFTRLSREALEEIISRTEHSFR